MKKSFAIITALMVIFTSFAAFSEGASIGSGLLSPQPGGSSAVIGGVGGMLTPPEVPSSSGDDTGLVTSAPYEDDASSGTGALGGGLIPPAGGFAEQPRSADNGRGTRPSPEWLGKVDSPIIADICAIANDPGVAQLMGIPDSAYALLDPPARYDSQPSVVIYAPDTTPFLVSTAMAANGMPDQGNSNVTLYSGAVTGWLYSEMNYSEIAMSASIVLNDYFPTDTEYVMTFAIYTSETDPDANPLLVVHTNNDGMSAVSAQFITASALDAITDPENDFQRIMNTMGLNMYFRGDTFPEFTASTDFGPDVEIILASDEWLTDTAFELAGRIVEMGTVQYAANFTAEESVIALCAEFGRFDIENASVKAIRRYEADAIFNIASGLAEYGHTELFSRYYGPRFASLMAVNSASYHGDVCLAASTVCTTSEKYFASGDFTSCSVILTCGGAYDIAVSFGNNGKGVIVAEARFIPAE